MNKNRNPHSFRELYYKIDTVLDYLKECDGYNYELYNRTCPLYSDKPDSNIIEYMEDIRWIVKNIIDENYYNDVPF